MKKILSFVFLAATLLSAEVIQAESKAKIVREAGLKAVDYFVGKAPASITGRQYIETIDDLDYWDFEEKTKQAILDGNIPDSLRYFKKIRYQKDGHTIEFWTLPDYLAIGTDTDYVRIPMGTIVAQQLADTLNCTLPTKFLVDIINDAREGAIEIFPFRPKGDRNMRPITFQDNNYAIEALFRAKGYHFGQFISGLKKDLILTARIESDSQLYKDRIAIYGWHHPDGRPQQPVFIRHANFYSDYSHGARMIHRAILIDGKEHDLVEVMKDPVLFRLVSDEDSPLPYARYTTLRYK